MNVLVIGSGGREHAICWKLQQSSKVSTVHVFPGAPAIAQLEKAKIVIGLNLKDFQSIASWCLNNKIDLVAVGPEDPLADGIADALKEAGVKCFGPSKAGAKIEADKDWSKAFMVRHNIPTAKYESFTDAEKAKKFIRNAPFKALVVKASGLAAGKGVIVAKNVEEACAAVEEILGDKKFGSAGEVVVIEELLSGEEISVLAFVDSHSVRVLPPAQDHKRLKENDEGLNTGGMGAYCPCPLINNAELDMVKTKVLQRAVNGLRSEGIEYNGILYAGMMLTQDGPKTLEFNCRFGDPETQVILPLLKDDLLDLMIATATNNLKSVPEIEYDAKHSAVGVVMASKGYPETSTKGCVIENIEAVEKQENLIVFHSGTAKNEKSEWTTNGGRVLINVAIAGNLVEAAKIATKACEVVNFDGAQFRRDIAKKAFRARSASLSYKDSGVDIEAGESLVTRIRPLARGTNRPGVIGEVGSFGGLFRLNDVKYVNRDGDEVTYEDPVLVQGTDGVGTKLKIAEAMNVWDTIGIDLVAMCVNDVLCNGAEPLAFLDYIACGHLDVPTAAMIVKGISTACRESNCALLGGETAEMPSMYKSGDFDLAGYCVGVVEHNDILPKISEIHVGDIVVGLPSSGVHSNGFSLVNKILKENGCNLSDPAPFSDAGRTFGREFLTPTKLYVSEVLPLLRKGNVKALAHITGGGLTENIPRILSDNLGVSLDAVTWKIPPVFGWLAAKGNVADQEMLRTYNCGIGMVLILPRGEIDTDSIPGAKVIGTVVQRDGNSPQIQVKNFADAMGKASEKWREESKVSISYKDSGVDIVAGDSLVQNIKPHAKSTNRDGVLGSLGGFGGLFRLHEMKKSFSDPVLVMGTDGVGTKLKIAQQLGKHDKVGVDLVAMCANDILCNGAEPLTFLDYFACGKLDVKVATDVISGIADGCRQSGSVLLGGETAEMPGMYEPNVYDLAGFALGITEYSQILPKRNEIKVDDIIIGFPSNGIHSNGFSLIRKIMELGNFSYSDVAPFSADKKTFGEEFLKPTKIYVNEILPAIETGRVKALAHITGGGMWENIPRILQPELTAELQGKFINIQPIFGWLTSTGYVEKLELMKTFNCGVGMILVASPKDELQLLKSLHGTGASVIGKVIPTKPGGHQLIIRHFATCVERVEKLLTTPKKRVGVLISGSGSNLQALIDATRNTSMGMCSEIVHVISNKPDVFGLQRAATAGITTSVISNKNFPSREDFDEALSAELQKQNVEIVCLAGFMRVLTPAFVQKWKGKLINIHPSLLPKYKGIKAQQEALESGDTETGCSVHFVDENVDTGAIITQEIVPIVPGDTVEFLSARILKSEHIAFPRALRLIANSYVNLNEKFEVEWA